jgi:hypothetical protein
MPIAEDAGRLPPAGETVPQDEEPGLAETLPVFYVTEPVHALFNGTVVLDGKDFEAACDQFAPEYSAHVLLRIGEVVVARPGDAPVSW